VLDDLLGEPVVRLHHLVHQLLVGIGVALLVLVDEDEVLAHGVSLS
jgi:hypothetical protein